MNGSCLYGFTYGFMGCSAGYIPPDEPGGDWGSWCSVIPYAPCMESPMLHPSGVAFGEVVFESEGGILRGGCGGWILGLAPDYRGSVSSGLAAIIV
jgi:hypothetical protein